MIRYGCHSENFGILTPEDTFRRIRELEFDCIDVASRSLMPQAAIQEDPDGCAAELSLLSSRYALPLSELFLSDVEVDGHPVSPVQFGCGNQKIIQDLERRFTTICRFAAKAGFSSIMGSAGREDPELGYEESFARAARTLRRQVSIAASFGLAFHVEPSRVSLLHTVDGALRMAEEVDGLRYTLDFLHYHIQGIPLSESMRLLPLAGHMHARQARIRTGKCDFSEGGIDYACITSRMKEIRWQGDIAMEFWCSDDLQKQGVQAVEQNIVMRYFLKRLLSGMP